MGALFSAGLATYLIYVRPSTAANVGFSLTMAIAFSGQLIATVVLSLLILSSRHDPLVGTHWE
jgi:hypothetical protein